MPSIQLHGKILLEGTIEALSGLHIGGNAESLDIGGIDNPVIRNPLTREPYIPGSSLRGKIRGLLDRHLNNTIDKEVGNVKIHMCEELLEYKKCDVCQVFGVAPSTDEMRGNTMPTRLIIRDIPLELESQRKLKEAETDGEYTEAKWEVAIDRITSEANPRQNERVPAGAKFGPFQIVHSLYTLHGTDHDNELSDELVYVDTVLKGMELLEDDYIGGSGSRGSGQIAFENLTVTFKSRECYEKVDVIPISITLPENADIKVLRQSNYIEQIQNAISDG